MVKKDKHKKEQTPVAKMHHPIVRWVIISLAIIIILFFFYRYTQEVKESAYLQGGQDAISNITRICEENGGIVIMQDNKTIVLANYNKDIDLSEFEAVSETVVNETNSTE